MPLFRLAMLIGLVFAATPARAERLLFDHRIAPELKAVLDVKDPGMISYNDRNPRYVVDIIAVRGKSAREWTRAVMIIARTPGGKVRRAADWLAELRAAADRRCPGELRVLAEDAVSVTFERRSHGCPADYPNLAIYRAIAGKRSLFLLAVMAKDDIPEPARRQWRAMLDSARIE